MTMSNDDATRQPREMLDAYLDGQLSGAALAAFERAMASDAALQQAVQQQRAIDASLGRLFRLGDGAAAAPEEHELRPAAAAAAAVAAEVAPAPPGPRPIDYRGAGRGPIRVPWPLAVAAIVLFSVGMSWAVWQYLQGPQPGPMFVQRVSLDQQYRAEVSRGFKASWKCKDEQEFMSTFVKQFGEPLAMDDPPAGVQSLGLSYNAVMSPRTTYMLAKVDGQDVVVFIDHVGCGGGGSGEQVLKQPQGLHVFNKTVGDFALYEVTPLDKPHLLDLFHLPAGTTDSSPAPQTTNN